MSRPPNQFVSNQYSDPRVHPGETIDFKVPAIGAPYQGDPGDYHPAAMYAQAGFPGYTQFQQVNAGFAPPYAQGQAIASTYPPQPPQGYSYPHVASAYPGYPQPLAAPASLPGYPPTLESEVAVQDRIRANIDAIMETQKTAMLNSKLETLTNKVQSLAQNIENSDSSSVRSLSEKVERLSRNIDGDSASHIKSLSEKVERLSRSIELSQRPVESLSSTAPISSSASDSDIARRLRRLAAESSARPEERIPDW